MLLGLLYTTIYVQNSSGQFNLTPYKRGTVVMLAVVSGAWEGGLALSTRSDTHAHPPTHTTHNTPGIAYVPPVQTAHRLLGYLGVCICLAMFGGPLQVIQEVLTTRSTRNLPFATACATFANCVLWSLFGVYVAKDPVIWGPNCLGLASAVVQLALFAKFGFAPTKKK